MTAAYVRRFNRISLLPISAFCPEAGRLSELHGAGRAAATSKAFHAVCAGAPEAEQLYSLLSDKEKEELAGWQKPGPITLDEDGEKVVLDYASAMKETPVALTVSGGYLPFSDFDPENPEHLTKGTLDFGWVRYCWGGMRVLFLADMKRSPYASPNGTESLQVHAYAQALAEKLECEAYVVGLWILETGEWMWSTDPPIEIGSRRHLEIFDKIRFAARNVEGQPSTGPHCSECYGRSYCGEYLLPAALAVTELAPVTEPGGITPDNAVRMLQIHKAMREMVEIVGERLKAYYDAGNKIENGTKAWRPVIMPGRESVRVEAVRQLLDDLRQEGHPLLQKYGEIIKRGNRYPTYRWVNK